MKKTYRLNFFPPLLFFFMMLISLLIHPQMSFADETKETNDTLDIIDIRNSYRIGIGDILEIITWKEPDFSRDNVLVRLDGKITFPLLDDIRAAGQTPYQLKQNIMTLLKQYLDSPNVTVVVREPASQRFYILGEVARTGEYPLLKELTVLQAFAMAGGFTEWATKKEIILIRKKRQGGNEVIKIDYKKFVQGKGLEQNIVLRADDTIIVP